MMPTARTDRKARFEAALKLAGLHAKEWAETNGVTPAHLSLVLSGDRVSERLESEIDAFTDLYLPQPAA